MFCPSCGAENPEGARFCSVCGAGFGPRPVPTRPAGAAPFARPQGRPATRAGVPLASFLTPDLVRKVALGSSAAIVLAFFLPLASLDWADASISGMQMAFGAKVAGMRVEGDPTNVLLLICGVAGLASTLLLGGRARCAGQVASGALEALLLAVIAGSEAFAGGGLEAGVGLWLAALAALALAAAGAWGLARPSASLGSR